MSGFSPNTLLILFGFVLFWYLVIKGFQKYFIVDLIRKLQVFDNRPDIIESAGIFIPILFAPASLIVFINQMGVRAFIVGTLIYYISFSVSAIVSLCLIRRNCSSYGTRQNILIFIIVILAGALNAYLAGSSFLPILVLLCISIILIWVDAIIAFEILYFLISATIYFLSPRPLGILALAPFTIFFLTLFKQAVSKRRMKVNYIFYAPSLNLLFYIISQCCRDFFKSILLL